jgi:Protein of unknown function (DUF3105)
MTYRQLRGVNLVLGAAVLILGSAACSGDVPFPHADGAVASGGATGEGGGGGASGSDGADAGPSPDVGSSDDTGRPDSCQVMVQNHPSEGAQHLEQCAPTIYISSPPSSGNHYPVWPAYKIYDQPVPWGFLVHGLEHGAVVISYRCDGGCPEELAKAKAFVAGLAPDVDCGGAPKLVVLVPDPKLDVAFAASAWTWTLRADCFDSAAFGQFVTDHYGHGLERVCSQGVDLSATNWCPAAP